MRQLILLWCLIFVTHRVYCAMSEKQMNATKKLVRNTCQSKSKVSNEQIDAMHSGDFSQGQFTPDGLFDWESGIKVINANAPPNIAAVAVESVKNCKDAMETMGDKCQGAAEIAKCIYDDNPEKYFLP